MHLSVKLKLRQITLIQRTVKGNVDKQREHLNFFTIKILG